MTLAARSVHTAASEPREQERGDALGDLFTPTSMATPGATARSQRSRSSRRFWAGAILLVLAILMTGGAAMSQGLPQPPHPNPVTTQDYKDNSEFYAALAAAQSAQTGAAAASQLAAATQAANVAAQQKALSDSQAAILKNILTVPASGYTGGVTTGSNAGAMEAALLAATAVNEAAQKIKVRIGSQLGEGKTVVLYGAADLPDFQAVISFYTQINGIKRALDKATTDVNKGIDDAKAANPELSKEAVPVAAAALGPAIAAASNILSYLRTDYTIAGVQLTPDQVQVVDALASVVVESKATLIMPALYNGGALMDTPPLVSEMQDMAKIRVLFQPQLDLIPSLVQKLTDAAAKSAEPNKTKMTQAVGELNSALAEGKAAVMLYDNFLTKATTADDKGKVLLAQVIQQDTVRSCLKKDNTLLLAANISMVGGTYYTKKNFWTIFGRMPFYTMGGAVINYTLLQGKNGNVLSAGVVPVHGGFHKVTDVEQYLSAKPDQGGQEQK